MIYRMKRMVVSDGIAHYIHIKDNVPTKGFITHQMPIHFKIFTELREPPIMIEIDYKNDGDMTLYGSFTCGEPHSQNHDFCKKYRPE